MYIYLHQVSRRMWLMHSLRSAMCGACKNFEKDKFHISLDSFRATSFTTYQLLKLCRGAKCVRVCVCVERSEFKFRLAFGQCDAAAKWKRHTFTERDLLVDEGTICILKKIWLNYDVTYMLFGQNACQLNVYICVALLETLRSRKLSGARTCTYA